jgi:cation:H+ antiporter
MPAASIFIYFVLLVISFVGLWFAGDLSVKYAIETASKFKLTTLFVGFVLIAISTGLPELFVVIASLIEGAHAISVGTILGSNVCDISFALGIPILIAGKILIKPEENKDSLSMLFITAIAMAIVFLLGKLTKITALFLILIYFVSLWGLWRNRTKKEMKEEEQEQKKVVGNSDPFLKTKYGILLKLFVSVCIVLFTSQLAVHFAIQLTKLLHLSLEIVGATILAVGTSLPEITLGLHAVKKHEHSLAIGNALGSVLEQGTLLLGILAIFSGEHVNIIKLRSLAPFMFLAFALLGFGIMKRKRFTRLEGTLMVSIFIIYLLYHIFFVV